MQIKYYLLWFLQGAQRHIYFIRMFTTFKNALHADDSLLADRNDGERCHSIKVNNRRNVARHCDGCTMYVHSTFHKRADRRKRISLWLNRLHIYRIIINVFIAIALPILISLYTFTCSHCRWPLFPHNEIYLRSGLREIRSQKLCLYSRKFTWTPFDRQTIIIWFGAMH